MSFCTSDIFEPASVMCDAVKKWDLEGIWRGFGGDLEGIWKEEVGFGGDLEGIWRGFGGDLEGIWRTGRGARPEVSPLRLTA